MIDFEFASILFILIAIWVIQPVSDDNYTNITSAALALGSVVLAILK